MEIFPQDEGICALLMQSGFTHDPRRDYPSNPKHNTIRPSQSRKTPMPLKPLAFIAALVLAAFFVASCAIPEERLALTPTNNIDDGSEWITKCGPKDPWDKAGPPFRIYGDTYYVGTCGIAAILVAGKEGHFLIDGGPRNGGPMIAANVRALGFDLDDVKVLLHSHEHFDHVGGLAYLKKKSKARMIASVAAAPVLESGVGAADDPQAGMHSPFAAVEVNGTIEDGEDIVLGRNRVTAIETPGHTPGALSWRWKACEAGDCKTVVYMDSLSPISNKTYRFTDHPDYVARYKEGLAKLAETECAIALTPHPAASKMFARLAAEGGLEDDQQCRLYAEKISERLEARLRRDKNPPKEIQ